MFSASRILSIMFSISLLSAAAYGADPYLVKDINSRIDYSSSSSPESYLTIGNTTFFFADDKIHGLELFKTDGTPEGTVLVKDTIPGTDRSLGRDMLNLNGILYFFDYKYLWRSDGTAAGTYPVKIVNAGDQPHIVVGDKIFFVGSDSEHDEEVWVSDGTTSGTMMVADINTTGYSFPKGFTGMGSKLLFYARDDSHGSEPWVTNGTLAGTRMLKDLSPGWGDGFAGGFVVVGSWAFFEGYYGGVYSLYKTDGTSGGTYKIKDVGMGWNGIAFQNRLFFASGPDGDQELWTSDGTAAGTVLFKDIEPGSASQSRPTAPAVVGSNLFFVTRNETNGVRLWKSDGTTSGTIPLAQIFPSYSPSADPTDLLLVSRKVGTKLVLFCQQSHGTKKIWVSDGTIAGTSELPLGSMIVYSSLFQFSNPNNTNIPIETPGGRLFFTGYTSDHGTEPWVTDGTPAGTHMLADIANKPLGVNFTMTAAGDKVYFAFNDQVHGNELWCSDGTDAGTFMVKDINTVTTDSNPQMMAAFNNKLYFAANDGSHGSELWYTDGTAAGTKMVGDIEPGSAGSAIEWTFVSGNSLFFQATTTNQGRSLYALNGSTGAIRRMAPIRLHSQTLGCLADWNGRLCMTGVDSLGVYKLWTSDGSQAGTRKIEDLVQSPMGFCPLYLTPVGNHLFTVHTSQPSYSTDGTTAGTTIYHQFDWGQDSRATIQRTALGDRLLVLLDKAVPELWISAGTSETTQLVSNAFQWPQGGPTPLILGTLNGNACFSIDDGVHGHELWRTDGTALGTALVKDINPSGGSSVANGTPFAGRIFFTATEPDHGAEIWSTDSTTEGTALAGDVYAGSLASTPSNLTAAVSTLFFIANDGIHGRELWAIPAASRQSQNFTIAAGNTAPFSSSVGVAVDFSANSAPGPLSLVRIGGSAPGRAGDPAGYWLVSGLPGSAFSAILRFTYDPAAITASGVSVSSLGLIKSTDGGKTWVRIPAVNDQATHSLQTTQPQTSFGLYAIAAFNAAVSEPWGIYR